MSNKFKFLDEDGRHCLIVRESSIHHGLDTTTTLRVVRELNTGRVRFTASTDVLCVDIDSAMKYFQTVGALHDKFGGWLSVVMPTSAHKHCVKCLACFAGDLDVCAGCWFATFNDMVN